MKKTLFSIIFAFSLLFFISPSTSLAGKGLPFGGRVSFVMPCINGIFIFVVGTDLKSIGPYIITPAVIPHLYFSLLPGNAIVGSYIPGIPCYIPPFIVIPTKGAVTEFGTSLVPGA